jgi:D-alanine-D-alanine ligase
MDETFLCPDEVDPSMDLDNAKWKMEWDVYSTLRAMGHDVRKVGLRDDLGKLREAVQEFRPDIAFNLLEDFHDNRIFDQHVVSYLELLRQPYTGCNPRGLTLGRDKALTKKIMAYHRIAVPGFAVFARGRRIARPKRLMFPLLVKSINVEGSVGIAQSSLVYDEQKLQERVRFIHESLGTYAIAEEYIDGRELYVSVLGNLRLRTFPVWELRFDNVPEGEPRIATDRAKTNAAYQRRWGIVSDQARPLPEAVAQQIPALCKRIYRILGLTGYARLDFRLGKDNRLYLLEANPNPQIGYGEDFAASAEVDGMGYEELLERIIRLGLAYEPGMVS